VQRELVERARDGDREAFAALAASVIARLFNTAQLMLRDRDLADDAVQETLVLAWRDLRSLRNPNGFEAWLHRILVRSVYREADRRRRSRFGSTVGGAVLTSGDMGRDVEDRDVLDRGFRRLRPEHRVVLVLHHYLGYSDDEAAGVLAVPLGTFKSRLNRATSALRAELDADARGRDSAAMEAVR
jgi:RNA polymerase sigma-70 factor (ECF subfamily)